MSGITRAPRRERQQQLEQALGRLELRAVADALEQLDVRVGERVEQDPRAGVRDHAVARAPHEQHRALDPLERERRGLQLGQQPPAGGEERRRPARGSRGGRRTRSPPPPRRRAGGRTRAAGRPRRPSRAARRARPGRRPRAAASRPRSAARRCRSRAGRPRSRAGRARRARPAAGARCRPSRPSRAAARAAGPSPSSSSTRVLVARDVRGGVRRAAAGAEGYAAAWATKSRGRVSDDREQRADEGEQRRRRAGCR